MTESQFPGGIAIVGLAGRFPKAANVTQYWENLAAGRDCFTEFTVDQLVAAGIPRDVAERPEYVRRCPVIEDPAGFDARLFRYSPREAEMVDPQQRILLECAWEALENAGHDPRRFPGLGGIWAGSGVNYYFLKNILSRPGYFESVADVGAVISNDKDYLASRIAYKLDLRGPAVVVQTACSTSLVAVHLAAQALLTYQCDLALAGGVSLQTPRAPGYLYHEGEIFSPDGFCRTFDARANGTVLGEGCGLVVLRRLEDAIADRDTILAVIRGSAVNNDGAARAGYTAPSVAGQSDLVSLALAVADVSPADVDYVEAHGTATALGDPIEIAALTRAFRGGTDECGYCGIGSAKSNIGHLDVAAGIAGLIKVVLSLRHRRLPPTIHFSEANPELHLGESPFFVVDRLTEWEPRRGRRIAGVSSFGLGGTNAHVVLEEYPQARSAPPPRRRWQVLPFSGATIEAVRAVGAGLGAFLQREPGRALADVAWTLAVGRVPLKHRRCVVADSASAAASGFVEPDALSCVEGEAKADDRPVVFLFSGQGSQYRGMGLELYRSEQVFRESMDRCSRLLGSIGGGGTLLEILYGGDEKAGALVNQTAVSQLALFAIEYSLAQLLGSFGVRPAAVAGHSIGEYAAACLAGVFSLEDALALVKERGRLMQTMVPGTMLAIPTPEAEVRSLLPADLDLAVVNAPEISVVSGPAEAVEEFARTLEGRGIHCRRLQTSHAFHSRMMEPAAQVFAEVADKVGRQAPGIPIASNLSGGWMTAEQAVDPVSWANHLRRTVLFGENLRAIAERFPSCVLLEVGPGNTLCSISRQAPGAVGAMPSVACVRHPRQEAQDQAFFLRALGALWCHGAGVDLCALLRDEGRSRLALPAYPFERQRLWIERHDRGVSGGARECARTAAEDSAAALGPATAAGATAAGTAIGPVRPSEESLRQLWSRVLGTPSIGLDDDFFELGGHSLLAVSIMVELERTFGVRLPLATLIEAPTIRQLLQVLEASGEGPNWSCLVALNKSGSKPPFFLMHSHGGNILEYQALANLLKVDRPIYALQCRGLDGSPIAETSVEEMANHYLTLVRGVQPRGPYYLGGFCFGGYLGLEVAHRLRAEGEEVALLVLINSATCRAAVFEPGRGRLVRAWHGIGHRLAFEWDELAGQTWPKKRQRLVMRGRRLADIAKTKAEALRDRVPAGSRSPSREHSLTYHLEQLADANDRAWARYRPKPYDGTVLFLRARKQPPGPRLDPLLGWDGLLTGEVTVIEVPGFRQNMLDEPNVPEVARVILERLP